MDCWFKTSTISGLSRTIKQLHSMSRHHYREKKTCLLAFAPRMSTGGYNRIAHTSMELLFPIEHQMWSMEEYILKVDTHILKSFVVVVHIASEVASTSWEKVKNRKFGIDRKYKIGRVSNVPWVITGALKGGWVQDLRNNQYCKRSIKINLLEDVFFKRTFLVSIENIFGLMNSTKRR